MPEQQTRQDGQYAQYDPVEGLPSAGVLPIVFTNTQVAASGAKINTHVDACWCWKAGAQRTVGRRPAVLHMLIGS